jgi:hypothetical protein
MKLKFRQRWQGHKVGQVVSLPDGMANVLIRQGMAEPVIVEMATIQSKAETASMNFGKRKYRG